MISRWFQSRPNLSLFIAGALAVLALPPVSIFPVMLLSLAWLALKLADAQTARQAFARGWWWAAGYFIFGWYWISFALRFDWPKFAWLLPLSILALPCAMAIYIGLMGAALHFITRPFKDPRRAAIFLFPIFFTGAELLRGHWFTGFPWNLIGSSLTDWTWPFQMAAVIGVYGLGFILCISVSIWLLTPNKFVRSAVLGAWIVMSAFGYWRVHQPYENARTLNVRIVQPNTAQEGRWDNARRREIMDTLLTITTLPGPVPDMVVWPEAASPYLLSDPRVRAIITHTLPTHAELATGTIRRDADTHQLSNSIEYINSAGELLGHYDKFHLVPFGEYMPFAKYLKLKAVAQIFGNPGWGTGPQTQTLNGVRISPLICYEAIFPGEVTDEGSPQLFVNVTDDVWYGNTAGPYQHLAAARARAVEEGIPMVRAANNGISAVVDRYGRIIASLPYDTQGALDAQVSIEAEPTRPPAANGMFYGLISIMGMIYFAIGYRFFKK